MQKVQNTIPPLTVDDSMSALGGQILSVAFHQRQRHHTLAPLHIYITIQLTSKHTFVSRTPDGISSEGVVEHNNHNKKQREAERFLKRERENAKNREYLLNRGGRLVSSVADGTLCD